jgi:hypothetical protein
MNLDYLPGNSWGIFSINVKCESCFFLIFLLTFAFLTDASIPPSVQRLIEVDYNEFIVTFRAGTNFKMALLISLILYR